MIRFLLDMGVAQSTARYLRAVGHDAVHVRDQGLERLTDDRIVAKAEDEHRAIVTHDLDFGRIVSLSGRTVPSIITLRLSNMRPAHVNAALDAVLRDAAPALARGALVTVTDAGVRVRELPVDVG